MGSFRCRRMGSFRGQLVPTLCVGMPSRTLRVHFRNHGNATNTDAERRRRRSHGGQWEPELASFRCRRMASFRRRQARRVGRASRQPHHLQNAGGAASRLDPPSARFPWCRFSRSRSERFAGFLDTIEKTAEDEQNLGNAQTVTGSQTVRSGLFTILIVAQPRISTSRPIPSAIVPVGPRVSETMIRSFCSP